MTDTSTSPFCTLAQTAALFLYSIDHFRKLVKAGTAPVTPVRIGGRLLFKREDVDAAISAACNEAPLATRETEEE